MGFCALAGTGRLDVASIVLGSAALLVRGYHLFKGKNAFLPQRWTTILTAFYFVFYALDYFFLSQNFVGVTVHMVLFVLVVKMFSLQRDRDLLYLAVIAFLMVLAAAILTVDTIFLFTFCLFVLIAMSTFVSMEMRRSEREAKVVAVAPGNENRFHRALYAVAGVLAVTTAAIGIVIFFVLPRMSMGGYLQTMASQTDLVTGFSDTVNLGGIGKIQQSNNAVMHVQVLDGTLSADQKWRGVALAYFDGRRWSNSLHDVSVQVSVTLPMHNVPVNLWSLRLMDDFPPLLSSLHRETLRYLVHMEPIGSHVFFLASTPIQVNGGYIDDITVSADGSVTRNEDAGAIQLYGGEADQNDPTPLVRNSTSQDYPSLVRQYLGLPPFLDPRIRALAADVAASAPSNYARARAIETYLSRNLGYTLDLPGEEADPLAHFLFERKKGHCEYFASSMAIMLRTLNVPARVVNGFRGGEYNDVNHTYIIRARDAHSWVEVYFPEYGWMTFDPTPSASAQAGTHVSSRLTLYLDALQEMWREWIINYDFSRQVRLGSQIGSRVSRLQSAVRFWYGKKYRHFQRQLRRPGAVGFGKVIVVAVLGMLLMALPFAPRVRRALRRARLLRNPQTAPGSAAGVWYLRMLKMMERRGIRKAPAQTAGEFASSIGDPEMQKSVLAFVQHYERARFAGSVEDALRLPQLYRELAARKG
jgi:hypothetical protein